MKNCPDCNKHLPYTSFHRDKQRPDGLRLYCKDCAIERSKNYYKNNKGYLLTVKKKHYKEVIKTNEDVYKKYLEQNKKNKKKSYIKKITEKEEVKEHN